MNLTEEEKRILGFLPDDTAAEKPSEPVKLPSPEDLDYGKAETEQEVSFKNALEGTEPEDEGMKFGTPVDFAEQFNNTLLAAIAAPFDVTEWAVNRAAAVVFPDKFSYNKDDLIDGEYRPWLSGSWGTSKNIETHVKPYIGTTEKADTYLGYAGNTFGEGVAFLAGGAGVVQKTKQAGGVVGAISRQADDALRNKLGTVVAAEGVAAAGMAGGRQYAEENEMGPVASFLLEFSTGALALVSGAAAKKTVLDPLTAKLKNMTATEALEKLSKEEVAEVVARGREEKAKVEPEAEAPTRPDSEESDFIFARSDLANELYKKATGKEYTFRGGDRDLYLKMEAKAEEILKNKEAPATPKETPEAPAEPTPAPKTPEAAPEADPKSPMQQLFDDYEKTIADQARGEGADAVVRLNAAFNAASDDFAKRVDALIANPDAKNVDEVVAVLDDYIKLDELDADLKQKTGQMLNAQQKNAKDNVYTKEMAENRQTRQEALKDVREKLQALKADADGSELQKLVDNVFEPQQPSKPKDTGDAPTQPEGTPKPTKPSEPKATPQQRAVARLQKRLDELRAIRSGEQDPKAPKPKKAKSAEEIDLEARIKFYQGEAKEVAEIAATEERIQVLSGLLQGGSATDIRAQIGLPPRFRPSHAKPKKIESTLSKLKATEAKLLKKLRRKQTDEILSDMRDVFDPENGRRSLVDQGLNKYLLERTDALLNQPSTMTTGLPSGIIQVMYRPLVGTGKSTLQALNPFDKQLKGVGMTARMKYAAADAIATAEQLISLANNPIGIAKQVGRNVWDTAKAGGQSAYYYKDGNKMDVNLQGASVGNSTIRNERQVRQASLRVEANKQKNFIIRKALEMISSDPATTLFVIAKAARSAGRVGVGTLDEPFILMLEGRKQRADAIRAAIKQQIPKEDVAQFIDDYVSKSSSIEGGVRRFNYLDEKYRNAANEHRRALFRRGDFDGDDPRMLMEEHFAQFWNKATGGDITMGKFFARFLQPIITTPTIALAQAGRTALRATGIPAAADVGQRVYSGVAKRIGKDGKISHALSGRINVEINDLEIKVKELRAKTKEKGLEPDELERRKADLAAHNSQLESLRSYRDEQTYEELAHTALAMGIFYTFFELGKSGTATGAGAFLTRDQRNNGEFQKYRLLADEDSEGSSYLLADPYRTLAALAADLGAWTQLEGATTEDQTVGNFITSTLEAYATDSVFSTSTRHLKDLFFGQEKSRVGALIDMGAGAIPVPSFIRGARTLDDEVSSVYDEGATFGEIPSRMLDKAVGTPAENFRLDKLGRPILRPERGALNYVFRYAPEERAKRMLAEEEVRRVLRNDSLSFNLIPKFTEHKTINGTPINLKKFTKDGRSLFNLLGEMVNENDEMVYEIFDMMNGVHPEHDSDWMLDYDDYTVIPNPDNPDELYNKGIERINDVRRKYIDKAIERISDESSESQLYRNKDGMNIFEYIESVEARPPRQGNILEKLNQF
jgi:hypothetical protein